MYVCESPKNTFIPISEKNRIAMFYTEIFSEIFLSKYKFCGCLHMKYALHKNSLIPSTVFKFGLICNWSFPLHRAFQYIQDVPEEVF